MNGKALQVAESGLVPIYEDKSARRLVNLRELWEGLESGWKFADWIQERIGKYGFVEGEDFFRISGKSTGGRPAVEYYGTIDMGKELAMVENNEQGRKVRKYFIEAEQRSRQAVPAAPDKHDVALKRADAMLNNSRVRLAKFVRETVKDIWDYLSPEAKQSYSAYVVETATGQPGLIPLPVIEKTYTASDIGGDYGVSANMVGRVANKYGLKTPEFGMEVLDKARGHDKQVPSFRYNERGREAVVNHLIEDGYVRLDSASNE